jgi:hypothetical protein
MCIAPYVGVGAAELMSAGDLPPARRLVRAIHTAFQGGTQAKTGEEADMVYRLIGSSSWGRKIKDSVGDLDAHLNESQEAL